MNSRTAKHRRKKRKLEAQLTVAILRKEWLKKNTLQILEFGAGACDQVEYLQNLGTVTAIDIYTHEEVAKKNIHFIECSATDTPFEDQTFDLIYANHVIAHIGEGANHELSAAFKELKRVGKNECIYAFSVPTTLWLLLSVPTHYFKMAGKLLNLPFKKRNTDNKPTTEESSNEKPSKGVTLTSLLFPSGLGVYSTFGSAFKAFKQKSWSKLFQSFGFQVLKNYPLALYGDSDFAIIPTTTFFNKYNITSSRLYILKKNMSGK